MKKYRLDLAKGPSLVTDDSHLAEVYLVSEVDALLRAVLAELEEDDLSVARIMVRNAVNGGESP